MNAHTKQGRHLAADLAVTSKGIELRAESAALQVDGPVVSKDSIMGWNVH